MTNAAWDESRRGNHEGPMAAPTKNHVLITLNTAGKGLKPIYHLQDGCVYGKAGYNSQAHTRWLPIDEAERLNLRCCSPCEKVVMPGKVERVARKAFDDAMSASSEDTEFYWIQFKQLLVERGVVFARDVTKNLLET